MEASESDLNPPNVVNVEESETDLANNLQDLAIGLVPQNDPQTLPVRTPSPPLLALAADESGPVSNDRNIPTFVQDINKWKLNDEFIGHLLEMGFTLEQAKKGLFNTQNVSVQSALQWILTYGDTMDDEPLERKLQDTIDSSQLRMTFVVNCSLQMGVGKVAAQVAHAALALNEALLEKPDLYEFSLYIWRLNGQTKIVLRGESADELKKLQEKAHELSLPTALIQDAGHTQIPSGSVTVLALFGTQDVLHQVTGHLKLL